MRTLSVSAAVFGILSLACAGAEDKCDVGEVVTEDGCADPVDADTDTDTDSDADADTDSDVAPIAVANLESDGVDLRITGGSGEYQFGIAQGGEVDNWTGEDCYRGYALGSGDVLQFCHTVDAGGTFLQAVGFEDLDDTTTLFHSSLEGTITFYLEDEDGDCWVWGEDTRYYDALDCDAM